MLDLTIIPEVFFEIKMLNKEVINVKKMTQKTLIASSVIDKQIAKEQKAGNIEKVLDLNAERLVLILNRNKENKVITKEEIENMDIHIQEAIIKGYVNWMEEVNSNPNL